MSDLMDVKEIAKYLKVKEWTIYEWLRKGKIPASRVVSQWRFKKEVIEKWLARGSVNSSKVREEMFRSSQGTEKVEDTQDSNQGQRQIIQKNPLDTFRDTNANKFFIERRQEERILIKEGEMFIKIIINFPKQQKLISQVVDMNSSGLSFKLKGEKEGILPGTPLKNIVVGNDKYHKTIRSSTIRYCKPINKNNPNDFRVGIEFNIAVFEHSVIRRKLLGSYKIRMPRYGNRFFASLDWGIIFTYKRKNIISDQLVNFSKFGLAFKIDKQKGGSFQKGDILLKLSLNLEDNLIYSGKATIINLEENVDGIIVRCSLEGYVDLENVFCLLRSKIKSEEIKHYIFSVDKTKGIETVFKAEIADLRIFLEKTKEKLDAEEAALSDKDIAINKEHYHKIILDRIFGTVFLKLRNHFSNIWQIVKNFDEEKYNLHKYYFQNQTIRLFLVSPFIKHSFYKPLGYAGDYKMINMVYDNPFKGNNIFAKLLNAYPIQEKTSRAVRNRLPYLRNKFSNLLNKKTDKVVRVMSIGSGPAREIQEIIKSDMPIDRLELCLLDADKAAISYSQEKIANLLKENKRKLKINFVNKAVDQLIKEKDLVESLGKYDLIYSVGLFDYLSLNASKRLTKSLYALLYPGSKLIIGNFNPKTNENKVYMDFVLEWYLFYRSEKEMLKFTERLDKPKKLYFETEDTGLTNFLIVEK